MQGFFYGITLPDNYREGPTFRLSSAVLKSCKRMHLQMRSIHDF